MARPGKTATATLLVIPVILAGHGCRQTGTSNIPYELVRQAGHPVLKLGRLTLIFESVTMPGQDGATLLSSKFYVPQPGHKNMGGTSTVDSLKITEAFGPDSNTISLDGVSFKLIENGSKLVFANGTIALSEGPRTLIVDKEGKAMVKSAP